MGLQKKENGNYVRIREGKFYLGKDKENPYDELEGIITDLQIKDEEWEGQTFRKLVIRLEDEGEVFLVSMRVASQYFSSFVSFLKNADITQRLTLIPVMKEDGDKKRYSVLIRQNGQFLKQYFTKDTPHGLPQMKKVKVSGKTLWDTEDFSAFLENVLLNEIKPQINTEGQEGRKNFERVDTTTSSTIRKEKPVMADEADEEEDDDLPF